jgi:hypothetical protein
MLTTAEHNQEFWPKICWSRELHSEANRKALVPPEGWWKLPNTSWKWLKSADRWGCLSGRQIWQNKLCLTLFSHLTDCPSCKANATLKLKKGTAYFSPVKEEFIQRTLPLPFKVAKAFSLYYLSSNDRLPSNQIFPHQKDTLSFLSEVRTRTTSRLSA